MTGAQHEEKIQVGALERAHQALDRNAFAHREVAMKLGFSGTRNGMTDAQAAAFVWVLARLPNIQVFHHGDCIGADAEAHELVRSHVTGVRIEAHPGPDDTQRAFCKADFVHPVMPHLKRNRTIVDRTEMLIAAPPTVRELTRSGTWMTIRYTQHEARPLVIVYPTGALRQWRMASLLGDEQ